MLILAVAWAGTVLQLVGAIALAGRLLHPRRCYAVMAPGALLLVVVAGYWHDWPQVCLMGTFLVINALGATRWRK